MNSQNRTHKQGTSDILAKEDAGQSEQAAPPVHAMGIDEVLRQFAANRSDGLSDQEVAQRYAKFGPNSVGHKKPVSSLKILARQFASPVMLLLGAALVLSFVLDDVAEAAAIGVVLVINALIGFVAEHRAVRSMEALRKLDVSSARVRREGTMRTIAADQLVPGDTVIIEAGDQVPADMRLIGASQLQVDEAVLTGESLPVAKHDEAVAPSATLHEQSCLLFKGTNVVAGAASGVVIATGAQTQLGRIAKLVSTGQNDVSPLEQNLAKLTHQLIWLTLFIAVLIGFIGLWSGHSFADMAKATVALAIAAIPEGLPIVATLALAGGLIRMARRNALVRSLGAVETLGSTTVILTDKTGTLTENTMSAHHIVTAGQSVDIDGQDLEIGKRAELASVLHTAALCSNASFDSQNGQATGDPLEVALMKAADAFGVKASKLKADYPRIYEHAFDTTRRLMATVHRPAGDKQRFLVAVKGAPEAVLQHSSTVMENGQPRALDPLLRTRFEAEVTRLASKGFRLIAIAQKKLNDAGEISKDPYDALTLLGIIALRDPPREDVKPAIAACHGAGVRIIMITGDHPDTARAIASDVGIDPHRYGDAVHARVTPEQKLELVARCQAQGNIVAMTGDGVNDAPALHAADIGVAMGIRGTDVAREAADIVLRDDAFSTIVVAIHEGRVIFGNIRRFCIYLLSCNLGEVLLIAFALLAGLPLPLLPLQILFLNLVTDVFPAFALATGDGDETVLNRPPRPANELILAKRHWLAISFHGLMISLSAFAAFLIALFPLQLTAEASATLAFLTIGATQLWHVFSMRDASDNPFWNAIVRNNYVWAALGLCIVLLLATVYLPALRAALSIVPPTLEGWLTVLICSLMPLVTGQLYLFAARLRTEPEED
ncbi:MAG: calcium-translocating P-type ATPase, SERCA-type [Hyphomicrobiales bacterium]